MRSAAPAADATIVQDSGSWSLHGGRHAMTENSRRSLVLLPEEGRPYRMGGMSAVFKADGDETAARYSISEWWLEPDTAGPGAHAHPEDDVFYVLEGTMSFLIDGAWVDCPKGSFVLAPGGAIHDFQNRSAQRAGVLNVSAPGGFEANMGMIVEWFANHPPGRATG
jgi:mannose-6-phosphate isomerase-like protein (cupin superfamily)